MKRIRIYQENTGYIAHHLEYGPTGWQADREIVALFGTHALPTAFTSHANPEIVLTEIQKLNPNAIVDFA